MFDHRQLDQHGIHGPLHWQAKCYCGLHFLRFNWMRWGLDLGRTGHSPNHQLHQGNAVSFHALFTAQANISINCLIIY